MEITIKIQELEGLITAINNLASALGTKNNALVQNQQPIPQQTMPNQNQVQQFAPVQPPIQQPNPMPAYQQPMQQAPIHPNIPAQQNMPGQLAPQGQVPTSHTAQNYTQDQIAVAMTSLCDAGKYDAVMGILSQFGAETLMQVPKDQYAALATLLRGAGANI
ncbi:MAG: hypothetical protein K0S04_3577 [Herbinix sp.]|jgi:hypothetical protein|nr:hypothetical protein [Herbinix sp.]